jgi:hypothetical protein
MATIGKQTHKRGWVSAIGQAAASNYLAGLLAKDKASLSYSNGKDRSPD